MAAPKGTPQKRTIVQKLSAYGPEMVEQFLALLKKIQETPGGDSRGLLQELKDATDETAITNIFNSHAAKITVAAPKGAAVAMSKEARDAAVKAQLDELLGAAPAASPVVETAAKPVNTSAAPVSTVLPVGLQNPDSAAAPKPKLPRSGKKVKLADPNLIPTPSMPGEKFVFDPVKLVEEKIAAAPTVATPTATPAAASVKPKGTRFGKIGKGLGVAGGALFGADMLMKFIGSFREQGAGATPEQMQAKVRQNMALQQSVDIMAKQRPEVYQAVLNLLGGVPAVGTDLSDGDVLFGGPAENASPSDVSPEQMSAFFGKLMGQ